MNGSTVLERHAVHVEADALDDVRVVGVRFLVDGEVVRTDYLPPYELEIAAPEGATQLVVEAIPVDAANLEGEADQVQLTVLPDDDPTVQILAPQSGDTVLEGTVLPIVVEATDDQNEPLVELYVDDVLTGSLTAPPYTFDYQVPLGATGLEVRAQATDEVAQTASTEPIVVGVQADLPPQVFILEPQVGAELVVGSTVEVGVGVADELEVESVRLFANEVQQGDLPQGPYSFDLLVPGTSQLRLLAEATDQRGQVGISDELVLTVRSDPGTTAVGTVVDAASAPVSAATVTCQGKTEASAADGSFSVSGVPAQLGAFSCSALVVSGTGETLIGRSAETAPVAGGITDVGQITVSTFSGALYPAPKIAMGADGLFALGDLNQDGTVDLIAPEPLGQVADFELTVALGNGDGTFGEVQRSGLPFITRAFALVDVNGDNVLDGVTIGNEVVVSLGFADGTFQPPVATSLSVPGKDMATGDFDGDGNTDLAVPRISPTAGVLLLAGAGDGTFVEYGEIAPGAITTSIVAHDVDGDGAVDLVVTYNGSLESRVHWGDGNGGFTATTDLDLPASEFALSSAIGDLDGDGRSDLVITHEDNGFTGLAIWHGQGARTFGTPVLIATEDGLGGVAIADLDDDGVEDVIRTALWDDVVAIHYGDGAGGLDPALYVPTGGTPISLGVADLNDDAALDLVTGSDFEHDVTLLLADQSGSFETYTTYFVGGVTFPTPNTLAVGDFDGTGTNDVVAGVLFDDRIGVLLGSGDGTLLDPIWLNALLPDEIEAVDVDSDGNLDIAFLQFADPDGVAVALGHGDGSFDSPIFASVGTCPAGLAATDLSQDGVVDLAISDICDGEVLVLTGNNDGTFQLVGSHPVVDSPWPVRPGDLNQDGWPDLVVSDYGSASPGLSVLLGTGGGSFAPEIRLSIPAGWRSSISLADFDGDSILDIGYVNENSEVGWLFGHGDGTFTSAVSYFRPERDFSPYGMAASDVNVDGFADLIVVDIHATVYVLLSLGAERAFGEPLLYASSWNGGVVPADLDGDGLRDLVTLEGIFGTLSVHRHR